MYFDRMAEGRIGNVTALRRGDMLQDFFGNFRENWFRARDLIEAEAEAARGPELCGLKFYGIAWSDTGGYAFLHRDVPMYEDAGDGAPASAFNMVVLLPDFVARFTPLYRVRTCSERLCVMERAGPCTPDPEREINAMIRRTGE